MNKITGAKTNLERHVQGWINGRAAEYDNRAEGVLEDLLYGGCASGIVGHLIYYEDTLAFYRKFRKDIDAMLAEMIDQGVIESPAGLNGWDKSDPLARDQQNQNLLAWFGFEETARKLANLNEIEI